MMSRTVGMLALAAMLLPACSKKSPPPAAASAEAVGALPPGAKMYLEVDLKAVLAISELKALVDGALDEAPPECAEVVRSIDRVAVATYGEGLEGLPFLPQRREVELDPETGEEVRGTARDPKVVLRIDGPGAAVLRGCIEKGAEEAGVETRTETRGGREVMIGGKDGNVYGFSVSDTTHVVVLGESMLDATLAAAGGGDSLAGDPLLDMLRNVPQGSLVGAMMFPPDLAEEMLSGLRMLSGGKDIPAPTGVAISVTFASNLSITGAIAMGDSAGAAALKQAVDALLSAARMGMSMAGADDPKVKAVKPVLDSIRIEQSGALLKASVSVPGSLLTQAFLDRDRGDDEGPRGRGGRRGRRGSEE